MSALSKNESKRFENTPATRVHIDRHAEPPSHRRSPCCSCDWMVVLVVLVCTPRDSRRAALGRGRGARELSRGRRRGVSYSGSYKSVWGFGWVCQLVS